MLIFALVVALSAVASVANASAPTITNGGTSNISTNSATIHGKMYPNGLATTYWINWGTTASYGNQIAEPYFSIPAQDTYLDISWLLPGLNPNSTYHYQFVADNSAGTTFGADTNFTTLPLPPNASTGGASPINAFSATLKGSVNPNGAATTAYFQWGPTTGYGNATPFLDAGSGNNSTNVTYPQAGLSPNTRYHYQLVATNSGGSNAGEDKSFTTAPLPPPLIQSVTYLGGVIHLSWQSLPGTNYQVQYSHDFVTWSNLGAPETAISTNSTFEDLADSTPYRFYRVELIQ